MRKEVFFIFARNNGKPGAIERQGFRINIDGAPFMYHKEGRLFIITDEYSGTKICQAHTLKEAKQRAKANLPLFYKVINTECYKKDAALFQALRHEKIIDFGYIGMPAFIESPRPSGL